MWYRIESIVTPPDVMEGELPQVVAQRLGLAARRIRQMEMIRKSLDARHKRLAFIYVLRIEAELNPEESQQLLADHTNVTAEPEKIAPSKPLQIARPGPLRPIIAGAGPAGLFAALRLAEAGLRPLVLERGDGLEARIDKVNRFWQARELDPESNIQYGMGGAGTFSDGKLTTRVKNPAIAELLERLIRAGAPPEIRYWQYPHIGTDLLRQVIGDIRRQIEAAGGEIRFRQRLTGLEIVQGGLRGIEVNDREQLDAAELILATGNSARDLYGLLARNGLSLEAKPFAVGLRIEHPQDLIDRAQYGRWAGQPNLGAAEYRLTYQDPHTGRGVYSFCMCPGGLVVGAASAPGGVVTNGMSYQARNSGVANAAIVVTVTERDYGTDSPLAGMAFQIRLEEAAYRLGGGDYSAPAQRVADFLNHEPTMDFNQLTPSYLPGVKGSNLWDILPESIGQALAGGIRHFGTRLKGFDWPDAVLTAVETRTSAPVRIRRGVDCQSPDCRGLYPCGEGAGYAGGIVSSALDGWRVADQLLENHH